MRVLALCAGYGGLELGLELAGFDTELVAYAEIDPHASKVMAAHWPDAPNLGDLTTITDPPQVDIVTAGFPCQPVSSAGLRKGIDDERWIIRDVVRVWRDSGARWLVMENVPDLLTANDGEAFGQVLDALAEIGADVEWTHLRAADAGACHRRPRWFAVAYADGDRRERFPAGDRTDRRMGVEHRDDVDGCGVDRWGDYGPAVSRWAGIVGRPAPDPLVNGRRLNPSLVEWMMGLPAGWVTDVPASDQLGMFGGQSPPMSHTAQLHILGNGVVPQQAAAAIRKLVQC